MPRTVLIVASLLVATTSIPSFAQTVPAPSRTVFKCEVNGRIAYSDSPCLGAKRVDVEPTRGLNKSTGAERIGADVSRERHSEAVANALRPIFGETSDQRAKRHRRAKLDSATQTECSKLDDAIPVAEAEEKQTARAELPSIQGRLLQLRRRFRDLNC